MARRAYRSSASTMASAWAGVQVRLTLASSSPGLRMGCPQLVHRCVGLLGGAVGDSQEQAHWGRDGGTPRFVAAATALCHADLLPEVGLVDAEFVALLQPWPICISTAVPRAA